MKVLNHVVLVTLLVLLAGCGGQDKAPMDKQSSGDGAFKEQPQTMQSAAEPAAAAPTDAAPASGEAAPADAAPAASDEEKQKQAEKPAQ